MAVALLFCLDPVAAGRESNRDVTAAIEEIVEQMNEALSERDVERLADFYAEDAKVFIPMRPAYHGRDDIEELWEYVI